MSAVGPEILDCARTVSKLALRGRRLAWGYGLYVLYYLCIGGLVVYGGVKWSSFGQIANGLVKLSATLVPLLSLIVVNAGLSVAVRYLVPMHAAGRWFTVAVAMALATVACIIYVEGVLRWVAAGRPMAALYSQLLALLLTCGYVFLAYRMVLVVQRLRKFVLVEGVWLPRLQRA